MEKNSKFDKRRAFNKAIGPGKNPKLINIGPTFIPDYRVDRQNIDADRLISHTRQVIYGA
jgi:hypothetical protein